MKKMITLSALLATCAIANAQETGLVISATPVMQQVAVPRQVCTSERFFVRRCTTQVSYESRPVLYDVVYMYGGQRYAIHTPYDPGPTIVLTNTPDFVPAPSRRAAYRSDDTRYRSSKAAHSGQPAFWRAGYAHGATSATPVDVDRQMR